MNSNFTRGGLPLFAETGLTYSAAMFRKKVVIPAVIVLLVGAVGWWQGANILSWHYVRQLAAASEERDAWVERVAALDTTVVPGLLALLERDDERACANAAAALRALLERWGPDDARAVRLLRDVQEQAARSSVPGHERALEVPIWLLGHQAEPATEVIGAAGEMLRAAAPAQHPRLAARALELAASLIERTPADPWRELATELAERGLSHQDAAHRVLGVNLALKLAKRCDGALVHKIVPRLRDPAAEVRRAALIAVGTAREAIADDDLLPFLHDGDAEVRRLCELALRSRGLQENHVQLARLISDPRPTARLQVLEHLQGAPELEPGVWLRRMTEDSDRAVRAAAVRAACKHFRVDLGDRIRHMAEHDPSETVRHIASIYLNQPR